MKSIKQTLIALAIVAAGASALPASAQWAGQYDSDVPYGVITRNAMPVKASQSMLADTQRTAQAKDAMNNKTDAHPQIAMVKDLHNPIFKDADTAQ
jgi:uncharacterized protein YbaA (DUF1428 family)